MTSPLNFGTVTRSGVNDVQKSWLKLLAALSLRHMTVQHIQIEPRWAGTNIFWKHHQVAKSFCFKINPSSMVSVYSGELSLYTPKGSKMTWKYLPPFSFGGYYYRKESRCIFFPFKNSRHFGSKMFPLSKNTIFERFQILERLCFCSCC